MCGCSNCQNPKPNLKCLKPCDPCDPCGGHMTPTVYPPVAHVPQVVGCTTGCEDYIDANCIECNYFPFFTQISDTGGILSYTLIVAGTGSFTINIDGIAVVSINGGYPHSGTTPIGTAPVVFDITSGTCKKTLSYTI